jgi:hypothetical protein
MKMNVKAVGLVVAGALALASTGCEGGGEGGGEGVATDDIRNPNVQTAEQSFPEAVLVNAFDPQSTTDSFLMQRCTGTLVAPRAVLTAGHCTQKTFRRRVVAPYVGGGESAAVASQFTDYVPLPDSGGRTRINFDSHDLAVFFLDRPICLAQYPTLAEAGAPTVGAQAVSVGRKSNGSSAGDGDLFVSPAQTLRVFGNRTSYFQVPTSATGGRTFTEGGDSGGPLVQLDAGGGLSKTVVGVTSAGDVGVTAFFTRVDVPAADRVKQAIASFGREPGDCGL